ncbi:uncharacterized protein L201_005752 [Kwoniella dendrophila CBS 6074]|uniref:Transaldolase n=1 Tax=Kwoniella dendrophila CBS 6074 TaxID=1295534 RepID=A0AAX4K219_9TREE
MYPYNNYPDPNTPPPNPQQRHVQPHPLNQNFRFPPLPSDTPQRSVSQPRPHDTPVPYGHDSQSSQLNPGASSFSFQPVDISTPNDSGLGRLKRYHDDSSGLGIDYGNYEEPYERRVSPRKQALARTMDWKPTHQAHMSSMNIMQQPSYDHPPQFAPQRSNPTMMPPSLHIQHDSQHYANDRAMLEISRSTTTSPSYPTPLDMTFIQNHAHTYHTPPPPMNRAWTLDSSSRTSLSPLKQSHQSLPLTLSPLGILDQRAISPPSQSVISAPYDSRNSPNSERRVISLSPNHGRRKDRNREKNGDEEDYFVGEKKYRGYRAKEGGPPKAVLGGPGGKTFEERLAIQTPQTSTTTSPTLSPSKGSTELSSPSLAKIISNSETSERKWKGKPLVFKLPPSNYSPPDSPAKPLTSPGSPTSLRLREHSDKGSPEEEEEEAEEEVKRPRKEAYPWPKSKLRLSPTGTPLPLSPDQPGEDTLRRPSIDSTPEEQAAYVETIWNGKEVLVSFPDENCWERLRPSTPSKQSSRDEDVDGTEAEVSAVLEPNSPSSLEEEEEDDDDDELSVNMVEDTVPVASPTLEQDQKVDYGMPWNEYPNSPIQVALPPATKAEYRHNPRPAIADADPDQISISTDQPMPSEPITHIGSASHPKARDDYLPSYTSPTSGITSQHKRSSFGEALDNADGLQRQLGGLSREVNETHIRQDTESSHVREVSTSSTESWKRIDEAEKDEDVLPKIDGSLMAIDAWRQSKGKSKMRGWSDDEGESDDGWEEAEITHGLTLATNPNNNLAKSSPESTQTSKYTSGDPNNILSESLRTRDEVLVPPKSVSKMRAWSDGEDDIGDMDWTEDSQGEHTISSPARLEDPKTASNDTESQSHEVYEDNNKQAASAVSAQGKDFAFSAPSGSKMRAWSDDGKEEADSVKSFASPTEMNSYEIQQEQAVPNLPYQQSHPTNPANSNENISRLRAWTPSPEPSKMRAWGLEGEDEDDILDRPGLHSTPARIESQSHAKTDSTDTERWINDKFNLAEFEEVPLSTTEISKTRPWEDRANIHADEKSTLSIVSPTSRLEKRSRQEETDQEETPTEISKMRAWSEDLDTPTVKQRDYTKWVKNTEQSVSPFEEQLSDFVDIMKERPADLENFRQLAMRSKTDRPTSPSRSEGRVHTISQSSQNGQPENKPLFVLKDLQTVKASHKKRPSIAMDPSRKSVTESFSLDSSVPLSPQAKRLRPTAESFKPPRLTSSYGALGISSRLPKSSSITPNLTPSAAPFVPRSTSFNFTVPPAQAIVNANAPAFVPRSASFTFMPPQYQQISSVERQLTTAPHSSLPSVDATFLPAPPPLAGSVIRAETGSASSMIPAGDHLRPTAKAFIPPQTSSLMSKSTITPTPGTSKDERLVAAAEAYVSPQSSAQSSKAILRPKAVPFVPPTGTIPDQATEHHIRATSIANTQLDNESRSDQTHTIKGDPEITTESATDIPDLIRPPSSDESILPSSEFDLQPQTSPANSNRLHLPPGRGRADTVAFGPAAPIGCTPTSDSNFNVSQDSGDEGRLIDDTDDLRGLILVTPVPTASTVTGDEPSLTRDASPRSDIDDALSAISHEGETALSRPASSDRPQREGRVAGERLEENSYHSSDTPALAPLEAVVPLEQIKIHTSQPVQIPISPRPEGEEQPDAPVSAHTNKLSNAGSIDFHPVLTEDGNHAPADLSPNHPDTVIVPSSSRKEGYPTPIQSTDDTFTSAAYMTADGSPLIPARSLNDTAEHSIVNEDPVEVLDDGSEDDWDISFIDPQTDIGTKYQERGFDRSAAPSPELPPTTTATTAIQDDIQPNPEPEPSPNPLTVNTKFGEWIYPMANESSKLGHHVKPSIMRRHTMPLEDQLDDLDSPLATAEIRMGVASTFATRVGELRAFLKSDEDTSRRDSVEFPMREERKTLGMVNVNQDDMIAVSSSSSPLDSARPDVPVQNSTLNSILDILKEGHDMKGQVEEGLKTINSTVLEAMQAIADKVQDNPSQPDILERVTSILEEHSRLLAALHETANQTSTSVVDDNEISHSRDLFAAILTSQHAKLDKFDEVASSQLSGSSTISQAIEALQYAQNAADQRSLNEAEQRTMIVGLREEIQDKQNNLSESRAQYDILSQRLKDTRQDRDELRIQLDRMSIRMENMTIKQNRLEGELDGVIARALAAELERDALAKSLNDRRDTEDGLRSELRKYQGQLEKERDQSQAVSVQKESEIIAMQTTIHEQISQIHQQAEKMMSLEKTISEKENEEQEERKKSASESTLLEVTQNTSTFQEQLMERLTKLDQNMSDSKESREREHESVLDRNRILQGEVDSLRDRLEASADRFAKLQLSTSSLLSANSVAERALSDKLTDEIKRREEAESKMEEMRKQLEKEKEEKVNWNIIASERQAMSRMQEVRLQALTQENVYWRQFALEHDRRRFKSYMNTKPFKNSDGTDLPVNGDQRVKDNDKNVESKEENEGTWYVERK